MFRASSLILEINHIVGDGGEFVDAVDNADDDAAAAGRLSENAKAQKERHGQSRGANILQRRRVQSIAPGKK